MSTGNTSDTPVRKVKNTDDSKDTDKSAKIQALMAKITQKRQSDSKGNTKRYSAPEQKPAEKLLEPVGSGFTTRIDALIGDTVIETSGDAPKVKTMSEKVDPITGNINMKIEN
ncbi:MAG: hypothetical protein ACJA1M_000630 [Alphaproteobacteria bacterium]|jgi:hypothetical protein